MSASLIVSLATSGRVSSRAKGTARVDFPLPGGPDATTKTPPPLEARAGPSLGSAATKLLLRRALVATGSS
jgi:hypothetical protein